MTLAELTDKIAKVVPNSTVYIFDPMNDGQHLEAFVVSPVFEGMSLVKQHQMVMTSLKNDLGGGSVHALALKTFTPEKWEIAKKTYGITESKEKK